MEDYDLVVIGAGAGGLVAAYVASTLGARVALVERETWGGDCLHHGCVPSKTLLHTAKVVARARAAAALGVRVGPVEVDLEQVWARVRAVIDTIQPHDAPARYRALGVTCHTGEATLVRPREVRVVTATEEVIVRGRAVVLATGARPRVPDWPGLGEVPHVTTDSVWTLPRLPERLVVAGGGPAGCELAQAFARLGAGVTLLERGPRLLGREDAEAAEVVAEALQADGVAVRCGVEVVGCSGGSEPVVQVRAGEGEVEDVPCGVVLLALGRVPNVRGLGLEGLGVELEEGRVRVDGRGRTRLRWLWACGDVASPVQLTHAASATAVAAAVGALWSPWVRWRVKAAELPRVTFTDPELAQVGPTQAEVEARGEAVEVTRYDLARFDRALTDGAPAGFVKVLSRGRRGRIVGATVVGAQASEVLAELNLARHHGLGLAGLLGTPHAYPTWSEAARHAASMWRQGRLSPVTRAVLAGVMRARRRGAGCLIWVGLAGAALWGAFALAGAG